MEDYSENKKSSYLQYWDVNSLHRWAMSQKLPKFHFEWVEDISQFNEFFIKNCDEKSEVGYVLEVDVQYPWKLYGVHSDLPFLLGRKTLGKIEKSKSMLLD